MPKPMKFWELVSAFREEPEILSEVLGKEKWRRQYHHLFLNFDSLVQIQDREALDAPVPLELSREIAKLFSGKFYYYPEKNIIRNADVDRIPDEQRIILSALEVHEKFGGSVIEEIFEYGSALVDKP